MGPVLLLSQRPVEVAICRDVLFAQLRGTELMQSSFLTKYMRAGAILCARYNPEMANKMNTTKKFKVKVINAATVGAFLLAFGTWAHANVTANPAVVNFANQTVGTTSAPVSVTVTNTSRHSTQIVNATMSSSGFSYSGPSLPAVLYQGQSMTISVKFAPTAAQAYTCSLVFTRGSGSTTTVALSGIGIQTQTQSQPPVITSQPVSRTVTTGQTASFSVAATGTGPMTYQWSKNGATISGATSSSYTTPAATTSDSGTQFTVAVSNSVGTATSSAAILTVNTAAVAPSITSQPVSQTVIAGQTATFFVVATGTAPLTYQWKKGGGVISGATSSTYATPAETTSDNGAQFTVVVTNGTGSTTSNAATLTVNAAPGCVTSSGTWVNSPLSAVQTGNFQFAFDATPSGSAIDGVVGLSSGPAGGYTSLAAIARFNVSGNIDARAGGNYVAVTAIPYSAGTTYHFILDVNIATHTYDAYVMIGSVQTTIGTNLGFRSEQAIASSLNNIGTMNFVGSQTVCNATVSAVQGAPKITTQPTSQTVIAGQTATFSVAATGTGPMTYQWNKGGGAISGATSSTYTTPAETISDNAVQFTAVVTNGAGSATSNAATLTVNALAVAPAITTQPTSRTVIAGQTATFSVAATGTAPMTYQWNKGGGAISGATSSTYTTPAEAVSDNAAQFTVVVTNGAGSATSNAATLTVNAATLLLNASSTSLSFGDVTVATSSSQNVTLTNGGNSSITISNVSVSGAGFGATGLSTGLILTPGQAATLSTTFTPAATGSVAGNVTVTSNASNSPDKIALSGIGLALVSHSVSLSWTPSTSLVIGYNSYSSTTSGGPYVKLTVTPLPTT